MAEIPDLWCIKTWKQRDQHEQWDQHGHITNLKWYQIGPRFAVSKVLLKNQRFFRMAASWLLVKEPSSCPLHKFEGLRSTIGPIQGFQGLKVFSHLSLRQLVQTHSWRQHAANKWWEPQGTIQLAQGPKFQNRVKIQNYDKFTSSDGWQRRTLGS